MSWWLYVIFTYFNLFHIWSLCFNIFQHISIQLFQPYLNDLNRCISTIFHQYWPIFEFWTSTFIFNTYFNVILTPRFTDGRHWRRPASLRRGPSRACLTVCPGPACALSNLHEHKASHAILISLDAVDLLAVGVKCLWRDALPREWFCQCICCLL